MENYMIDTIANRKSTRKYNNTHIEEGKILKLIESARLAHSGSNTHKMSNKRR